MDKRKFRFISDLISCQKEMFSGKSKALEELYDLCDNEEKESLVKQLLVDFTEMNAFAKQSYSELSQLYRQSILN